MNATIDAINLLASLRSSHDIVTGPHSVWAILKHAEAHLDRQLNAMIRGEK